uniref:Uncharacterized protein n=1 Tax=Echinococcus granulosus TaxID=6210 RepID=A0A068X4Z0_ECHGR|nr:hypothetical protein EgrG_000401800 [Echinococcus granulosus]
MWNIVHPVTVISRGCRNQIHYHCSNVYVLISHHS